MPRRRIRPEEILEAIRRFATREGRLPTARDFTRAGNHLPSLPIVVRAFRTWQQAVESAMYATSASGGPLRSQAWTDVQAAILTIDPATVPSAVLRRLIAEVQREPAAGVKRVYDRTHNRHNRGPGPYGGNRREEA